MNKLLFISNLSGNISYSEVSINILKLLKSKLENTELYVFSIGCINKFIKYNIPLETNIDKNNIFVINEIDTSNGNNHNIEYYKNCINGYNLIEEIVNNLVPDVIFIFNDNQIVNNMIEAIENIKPKYNGKIISYTPIDFGNISQKIVNTNCDLIFVPTDFTKDMLEYYEKNTPILRLPHFISNKFKKIEDQMKILKFREKYFGIENINKFVIGAINANSIRKRWDLLIESFCRYFKKNNNSLLFIKTTKIKGNDTKLSHGRGFDLDILIKKLRDKYDISNNNIIIFTKKLKITELNEIYNSIDLFINTTDGEGFGLTPLEAGLCGKVSILPNYTSFESIFEKFESPNFLLPVNIYSAKLIRDNDDISNILTENQYYCIYYSSKHYRNNTIKTNNSFLPISKNIKTIYISNLGSDTKIVDINPISNCKLFVHLKTFKRCMELLDKLSIENKIPNEFQILISSSSTIMDEVYESLCIYENKLLKKYFKRNIYITNKNLIEEYGYKNYPHVGLIEIDDMVDKIDFYEKNRDVLNEDGEKLIKFVKDEFNEELFYDILDRSLNEFNIYL